MGGKDEVNVVACQTIAEHGNLEPCYGRSQPLSVIVTIPGKLQEEGTVMTAVRDMV
jgi:hypothetical protein